MTTGRKWTAGRSLRHPGPLGLTGGAGAEIWYNEDAVRRRLNTGTLPLSAIKFQEADT